MDTNNIFDKNSGEGIVDNETITPIVENKTYQEENLPDEGTKHKFVLGFFLVTNVIYAIGFGVAFMLRLMFLGMGSQEYVNQAFINLGITILFLVIYGFAQVMWYTSKKNLWLIIGIVSALFLAPVLFWIFTF